MTRTSAVFYAGSTMSVTGGDSIGSQKPDWLAQIETLLEVVERGSDHR
jgi:hypothetical protein